MIDRERVREVKAKNVTPMDSLEAFLREIEPRVEGWIAGAHIVFRARNQPEELARLVADGEKLVSAGRVTQDEDWVKEWGRHLEEHWSIVRYSAKFRRRISRRRLELDDRVQRVVKGLRILALVVKLIQTRRVICPADSGSRVPLDRSVPHPLDTGEGGNLSP